MKKNKSLNTNYSKSKINAEKISYKVKLTLEKSLPKSVFGMLAVAEEYEGTFIFYKRYQLVAHEKNNYEIIDLLTKETAYKNISMFISALHIIYNLSKFSRISIKDRTIYMLDQEYYRCLEDIKFYKKKIRTVSHDKINIFYDKLENSYYILDEIKTQLSKLY